MPSRDNNTLANTSVTRPKDHPQVHKACMWPTTICMKYLCMKSILLRASRNEAKQLTCSPCNNSIDRYSPVRCPAQSPRCTPASQSNARKCDALLYFAFFPATQLKLQVQVADRFYSAIMKRYGISPHLSLFRQNKTTTYGVSIEGKYDTEVEHTRLCMKAHDMNEFRPGKDPIACHNPR
ncbi:hypothetical protein L228DRAFT_116631 [Xylona heveae TC161]|uniref:Uncharacterized protein n=1 Tax=Xylona heveae (strain CBS 132557 / TC161) TaxID=1328760 RepID=A0A165HG80_XYLHT|nr:hypothetical protein L228DRAFT_116631 [Xylona heveae TC161]KZF23462.1 hypothetical protein L228DRAFT_116631 [Xylona heveae TC161]